MKKYKKKLIIALGKLSIVLSVLLGVVFGLPSVIYADYYSRLDSHHYYVSVNAYGSNSDITFTWAPMDEPASYVDVVTYKCQSSSNTVRYVLVLYGSGSVSLNGINASSVSIESETYYAIDSVASDVDSIKDDVQNINTKINAYLSDIWNDVDNIAIIVNNITSRLNTINNTLSGLQSALTDIDNMLIWQKKHTYVNLDLYTYLCAQYFELNGGSYDSSTISSSSLMPYNDTRLFRYPYMRNYTNPTELNTVKALSTIGEKSIFIFASSQGNISTQLVQNTSGTLGSNGYKSGITGLYYYARTIINDKDPTGSAYFQIQLNNMSSSTWYYPIYYGPYDTCPYLDLFNLKSDNATELDNENDLFENSVLQLNGIETSFDTDFNTNINSIDLNTNLTTSNKFSNSAYWVVTRFNDLTLNTPFGDVLTFSLIIGISLLLIGRIL